MTTTSIPPREPAQATTETAAAAPNPNARVIKRYSNRKLYDTVESRYVTLPQIAELLRKGEDVRIIDNNSKEDLTSVTLAQILYEEERKQSRALPLSTLKNLIHTSSEKIMSTVREGPLGKLMGARPATGTDAPPPAAVPEPPPPPPATDAATASEKAGASSRLQEMLDQSRAAYEEWQHKVDDRVRKVFESLSPSSQIEKLQAEVRKLQQRLEELEARLASRNNGPRKDGE